MLFLGIINVVEQKYFFLIFWLFEYTAEVSFSGVEKAVYYIWLEFKSGQATNLLAIGQATHYAGNWTSHPLCWQSGNCSEPSKVTVGLINSISVAQQEQVGGVASHPTSLIVLS